MNEPQEETERASPRLTERLKALLTGDRGRRWIVAAGLLGIGLILLSGLWPSAGTESDSATEAWDAATYTANLEQRLTDILSRMEGVGDCRVMITLENAGQCVYTERNQMAAEVQPTVKGVIVACTGAADETVAERVQTAVQTVLHLTAKRVCVTPLI